MYIPANMYTHTCTTHLHTCMHTHAHTHTRTHTRTHTVYKVAVLPTTCAPAPPLPLTDIAPQNSIHCCSSSESHGWHSSAGSRCPPHTLDQSGSTYTTTAHNSHIENTTSKHHCCSMLRGCKHQPTVKLIFRRFSKLRINALLGDWH